MNIPCHRCRRLLPSPSAHNADYVIADDTTGVDDVGNPVQKAAVVCPECCLPTDTVIWGVHKLMQVEINSPPVDETLRFVDTPNDSTPKPSVLRRLWDKVTRR